MVEGVKQFDPVTAQSRKPITAYAKSLQTPEHRARIAKRQNLETVRRTPRTTTYMKSDDPYILYYHEGVPITRTGVRDLRGGTQQQILSDAGTKEAGIYSYRTVSGEDLIVGRVPTENMALETTTDKQALTDYQKTVIIQELQNKPAGLYTFKTPFGQMTFAKEPVSGDKFATRELTNVESYKPSDFYQQQLINEQLSTQPVGLYEIEGVTYARTVVGGNLVTTSDPKVIEDFKRTRTNLDILSDLESKPAGLYVYDTPFGTFNYGRQETDKGLITIRDPDIPKTPDFMANLSPEEAALQKRFVTTGLPNVGYYKEPKAVKQTSVPVVSLKQDVEMPKTGYGGLYSPTFINQARTVQQANKAIEETVKSEQFYKRIGYEEYGGKYTPFDVPKGFKVSAITETEKGLNISFTKIDEIPREELAYFKPSPYNYMEVPDEALAYKEPSTSLVYNKEVYGPPTQAVVKEKSITKQILEFDPFDFGQELGLNLFGVTDKQKRQQLKAENPLQFVKVAGKGLPLFEQPTATIAGVVGTVESFVRPDVPVASVEATKDVINAAQGKEAKALQNLERNYGASYIIGSIAGDVLLAKGFGLAGKTVGLSGKALVAGATLNIGVAQAISYTGPTITKKGLEFTFPKTFIGVGDSRTLAYAGAGEAIIGAGAIGAIAKYGGKAGQTIATKIVGRAAVEGTVDAAIEGVANKGDIQAIGRGFVYGSLFSAGFDVSGKVVSIVKAKLPKRLGGVDRMLIGEPTTGKAGQEVGTYVSKDGVSELGGKRVRVVPDVSEKVVGFEGVTTKSIVEEYTGKVGSTAHATLNVEGFNLKTGQKTLLKGFPDESSGLRKRKELFGWYSAPSIDDEFITIYGGYGGIGEGYSGEPAKIKFGGKSSALLTLETEFSPLFRIGSKENVDTYFDRVMGYAGKTGVGPETVVGASPERQVVTTTSYVRKGKELIGTEFVSEGKIGTFQIKQPPSPDSFVSKIPLLRDLAAKYTEIDLYKGRLQVPSDVDVNIDVDVPVSKSGQVEIAEYSRSYGKTFVSSMPNLIAPSSIRSIISKETSVSNIKSSLSVSSERGASSIASVLSVPSKVSIPSLPSAFSPKSKSIKSTKSDVTSISRASSVVSSIISPSVSGFSKGSVPSFPSKPVEISVPSYPGRPSEPSVPSYPSRPSEPSVPSYPSKTSDPSTPSYPSKPPSTTKPQIIPIETPTPKKKKRKREDIFSSDLFKQKLKYPIKPPTELLEKKTRNPIFKNSLKKIKNPFTSTRRKRK